MMKSAINARGPEQKVDGLGPDQLQLKDSREGYGSILMWLSIGLLGMGTVGAMWWAIQSTPSAQADTLSAQVATAHSDPSIQSLALPPADAGEPRVVARVNGKPVSEMEIAPLMRSGLDRAIVVDRYINKVIAAEQGLMLYPQEAEAAIRSARREVLATVYTTRRMQELRDAVTDAEIKKFYDENILEDNFRQWKVSYYLTTDPKDIESTRDKILRNDRKALEQLVPLVEQGDGYLAAQAMPYGLGRVVSKMKKGDVSEVLRLRNGLMILRVEERRQLDRPKMPDIKDQIVETLALQKFNRELEQARRSAKVELG